MKLFILLFSVCFISSCVNNSDVHSSEEEPAEAVAVADVLEQEEQDAINRKRMRSKQNVKVNSLEKEEIFLSQERKRNQRNQMGFAGVENEQESVSMLCRRLSGCRKFCSDWLDQNKDCHQWPAHTVVNLWVDMVDSFDSEQMISNVEWMAQNAEVSLFLRNSDVDHSVMRKIISRLSHKDCPLSDQLNIYHTPVMEEEQNVTLYLSHPEGREQGLKKIIDPDLYSFNLDLFKGSLKKCLKDNTLSLTEYMLAHENQLGFETMHHMLTESCGNREECVQLAYCKIKSPAVWSYIDQVRYHEPFNTEVQSSQCSYDDFDSLPFPLFTST